MENKARKFQIRFNVNSTTESDRWRLITDGEETLVANIIINGHTYTTMDWMEEIQQYKWHISCEGFVDVKNNTAYVTTVKEEAVFIRHLLKTISYRLLGTLTTVLVAYIVSSSITVASLLGFGELLFKPLIYFFHERLWYKYIRIGKSSK